MLSTAGSIAPSGMDSSSFTPPLETPFQCASCGSCNVPKRRASLELTPPESPTPSENDFTPPWKSSHSHKKARPDQHEYGQLAHSLVMAMSAYLNHLQHEDLPSPSLEPTAVRGDLKDPDGVAAQNSVVEIAQRIIALTMNPEMNLLVSSLQFHFCSSLKVAIDLKVHKHIPRHGSITSSRLAAEVGADETVLVRIMRVLTSKHVFSEPSPGTYAHTAISWCLMKSPDVIDLLGHRLDDSFRASSRQADALALANYREPDEAVIPAFSLAFETKASYWEVLSRPSEEERSQRFNRAMRAVNLNTLDVIPRMYPFDRVGSRGDGLLVDVGGGLGQVAREIMTAHGGKSVAGKLRCIVQDAFAADDEAARTGEIAEANRRLGVQLQRHNFFEEQPVRGAAVYFFRHIFHDWPDRACIKILKQTVKAMGPDSRLLICDQVVADTPSVPAMLYDIDMWSLFGGKERNRSEWEYLFREADERLRISRVWTTDEAPTTILEVCLGED